MDDIFVCDVINGFNATSNISMEERIVSELVVHASKMHWNICSEKKPGGRRWFECKSGKYTFRLDGNFNTYQSVQLTIFEVGRRNPLIISCNKGYDVFAALKRLVETVKNCNEGQTEHDFMADILLQLESLSTHR